MNTTSVPPSLQAETTLKVLRQAVENILNKKSCLGQYSVMWRKNRPVLVGADAPRQASSSEALSQTPDAGQDEDFERQD